MNKQAKLFLQLIDLAGGRKKFLEITETPAPRLSEWLSGKHQISLTKFLEFCEKCNVNVRELF
jgi:hypothetical protein